MLIPHLPTTALPTRFGRAFSAWSSFRAVALHGGRLFLALAFASSLHAQITTTWTDGAGDWLTATNWDNGVPGSTDTAILGNSGSATLSGAGAASILKVGNTDLGDLQISGGTLTVGSNSILGNNTGGTATATVSSGSWSSGGSLIIGTNSGTGTLTISGGLVSAAAVNLGSPAVSSGTLNLNGGMLATGQINGPGDGSGVSNINFNGGIVRATADSNNFFVGFTTGNIQFAAGGATFDTQAFSVSVANILQGPGGFTKQGSGTLNLSGSSSYANGTTVSAGTLALIGGGHLADTGAVTVSGGEFNIGTIAETAGIVTLNSGSITGTTGSLTGNSYAVESGNISAQLAGNGGLTKTTPGIVILSGSNSYTGATTVSAGTLEIDGSTAASSAVGVGSGATLSGNGTVGGSVLLNTGAIIAPGNGIQALTVGSLTWNGSTDSSATMIYTLSNSGNTSSLLNISGILAKGGGSSFIFDFQGTGFFDGVDASNPNIYTLADFSSSTGFNVSDFGYIRLGGGFHGNFILNPDSLQFAVIPEPSAWGLLLGGLAMMTALRRKRALGV